jgi:hypothetical protein
MVKKIKQLIFALRYTLAVQRAKKIAVKTGSRCYVTIFNGRPCIVIKQRIEQLASEGYPVKVEDLERMALFITK